MKRLTIMISIVACGVLLATAGAFMQSGSRPQLGDRKDSQQQSTSSNELPSSHFNQSRLHKLIITDQERAVYDRLAESKAIHREIDYGSYKLIIVDEEAAGGRAALQAMPVAPHDEQSMMVFNGYIIDTSNPQPLSKELPADLKQSRMSDLLAGDAAPGKGLYIVQFVGPVQEAWLTALAKTGAETITYAPNNSYVVRAGERAAGELMKMKAGNSFVQWLGDFQPAYKLAPGLQALHQHGNSQPVRVTVQLIESAESRRTADQLKVSAMQYFGERRVLKYRNVTIMIPASRLAELAQSDEVIAIEEVKQLKRLDEAQGQIVAGNLSSQNPSGPGYLAWLAGKGFNGSQFSSFAVNVVDDAYSLRGHPDLPDSRIAFENNPANASGPQSGHGFLNSHIVGGFNDSTGQAYEDANGFNYGLGIAPWARVGVTDIFCGLFICEINAGFNPTLWEGAAYGQGARVSSNSWGASYGWYDTLAQEYDSIVRDAQSGVAGNQQLAVLFAAGNVGIEGSIASPGTAKNVITVGASENIRTTGTDGCGADDSFADHANDLAAFSSRGPVNSFGGDGRVKPDIVAPGTHIQAGVPQSNFDTENTGLCDPFFPSGQTLYGWSTGTSHSTPAVAGGAALIYQDFLNRGLEAPSPAMIKAVLMNSASYLTGEGSNDTLPSNGQGMGLMTLGRAFDGVPRLLTDQTRVFSSSGETYLVTGAVAASDQPFRVTLAWTDAPGATIAAPWVNNLDLEVSVNGQIYNGNVFSGANSTGGGIADVKNNVESVFLPAGVSGNFVIKVRATNIAGDGIPGNDDLADQDFALVVYNANSAPLNSPIIEVAPSSFNFTAIAGVSPTNQSLSINNIGIDTLNWMAGSDVPWLTVSQASGSAPSFVSVIVNSSALSIGTYTGTITIGSANAFNSPVNLPVTLTVLPAFSVSPSSMSFVGMFGGISTEGQTLNISNNDPSLLDWTASSDVPWLTISPASGSAPSTSPTVSVDLSGLSIGSYTGTITISSTNPSAKPVTVPVRLIVNMIANTGFERSIDPWILSGVAMRSTGGSGHSGNGYLLLGGANSSSGSAYQQVAIPCCAPLNLTFWLNVTSVDTATRANDKLFVEIRDTQGRLLRRLATFSNLDQTTPGSYILRGGYNLAKFSGQTVRIQFRTTTDSSSVTSFRVDDIFVQ
jgi:Subtilase family/Viral BACON domain